MNIDILTIFPEYFAPLDVSLLGKARRNGLLAVQVHDLREWTHDRHRTVDDTPYGGGPGMVMKPEPWGEALDTIAPPGSASRLIIPTPSGRPFTQALAVEYAAEPRLLFACGRYEGIDSRVADEVRTRMPVDEISLGDFVLAGGEVAVLVMVEAIGRLLPGVLGNADSVADDSFAPGAMESLLEGPVYTKPPVWRDRPVPDVLLSGHHGAIARWRRDEALRRTARNRPELLERLDAGSLDGHDRDVLREAGFPVDGEGMAN
ncbi:tRNA (guanosine(37)-N1)-methyltransferase TrmD [Actinomadura macra]|uniref:tRNA (guanosine(37)-N1)-methyltransferase TrmD n=1 Tax=Actinomadura macra TaxID=46164 RepID=UPI0008306542|nr:tRNA (guanosine(37)-N1)-methyltransferase TrmD [Actinomadura macra]